LEQTAFQLLDEHRALGRRRLDVHHALRRTLLESLLIRLANSPDAGSAATSVLTTNELFGQFMDAVELRFRELHQADEYARMLGCSVRTLSRATRRGSGKGPRQIINERRLLEARRLLIRDHWDSRTVAEHLGFANAANFGRFFRTQHGTTPAAYAAKRDQQHGGTSNLDVPPLRPSS
jgi:AraC-like DNA-binding protein